MPSYVQNYVAIHGDAGEVTAFKERYFTRVDIPFDLHNEVIDYVYKFDIDALFPIPEELRQTGSPTQVCDTQEEVDRANATYLTSRVRGDATCIAISRNEALRRTFKYGRTLVQRMYPDGSEYGILNGNDWADANRTSTWRYLPTEVICEEPGLLAFIAESVGCAPAAIYNRLVDLGFKVAWAWQGEQDYDHGMWGDYVSQWKRRVVWEFQPAEAWPTAEELERRAMAQLRLVEHEQKKRYQQQEMTRRRQWAEWFRERPEDWKAFFPGHDMEAWITKIEAEEDEV